MTKDFLQAEVAALLRSSPIGKADAARALDAALNEVYSAVTRKACCPRCKGVFSFAEPTTAYSVRVECPSCSEPLILATGVIKSKRFNSSSMVHDENGLFLRFTDAVARERYIHVRRFWSNVELKSKDVFSLAVGENEVLDSLGREGLAAVMNLTLLTPPVIAPVSKLNAVLESLQTPAA